MRARALTFGAFAWLLLLAAPVAAGEGQAPISHRDKLYGVDIQGAKLWVVGYPGRIAHSADRGATWQNQEAGTIEALYDVGFADEQNGWIVGRAGTILHTRDGGATWVAQASPKDVPLLKVDVLDARHAFASGAFGTVIGTSDGGATWKTLRYSDVEGEDPALNGVSFATPQSGWAVGEFGTVLRTTDGGVTWEAQESGVYKMFFGVHFGDAQAGWAWGSGGQLVSTTDGGATWTEIATGLDHNLLDAVLLGDRMVVVGQNGTYAEGRPGASEARHIGTYLWLSAVALTPEGLGAIVGRNGTLFLTTDGGKTWRPIESR